jgi:SAM-dependent methyltransferase
MPPTNKRFAEEVGRIRSAYARRDRAGRAKLYAWSRPDVALGRYLLLSAVARLLRDHGWHDFGQLEALDVGCGTGAWLRTLQEWGAAPQHLHGIDLLADRIEKARVLAPPIDFQVSEGWPLPFQNGTMDLVSAFTVFSSILDPGARLALAQEMQRVMRTGGSILLYDFRVSDPRNPDTKGVGLVEVRRLFPELHITRRSLTLAPPLQRFLSRLSPLAAHLTEAACPLLRTHALYLLQTRHAST